MRRMQLQQLETGLHCASRGIGMVLHDPRDLLARQLDRHTPAWGPGNTRGSDHRRLRYYALRATMPELKTGQGAFRAHRLRNICQAGDHPVVVRPKLCVKRAAAGIVGERDFDDDQSGATRGACPVVFDVLSCRAAVRVGIHGAHRRLHDAIAKRETADVDREAQRWKQRRWTLAGCGSRSFG